MKYTELCQGGFLMKYLVVDVYALSYRALYGYPNLRNKAGESTSVLVGFFKQFISRVSKVEEYYPVFVADSPGKTFRHELCENYKANRQKKEDSFYGQIDKVLELCALFGTVYRESGYEADDLAACFINRYLKEEDTALLLTVDADWLQMLSRNVSVLQLKANQLHILWTDELFLKEYGITPKQIVDLKAIVGDGSDNIGGVRGVGDKQTLELLKDFQTAEGIYDNIIRVSNKRKLQTHLIENMDKVLLNKKLVSLNTSIDSLSPPDNQVSQEAIDTFIDKFQSYTDSIELTNILGVYLQRRRNA